MVSRVDSLVKDQLPVDSLVKKLLGQDCGCTNSGDGDAGNWSAVCVCVVGKSCDCDFQDEKRDNDCCDDLKEMYRIERKETNEETEDYECQSNHSKSELSRGRHFPLEPEETYLLDVRLLSDDDCGALDFACNVAASEPAAPLRGVCREGLLRQSVRSTAVLKKTVLDPISLCGKRPLNSAYSKPCKFIPPCTCSTDNYTLDLKPLMKARNDLEFNASDKDYTYYLHPCNVPPPICKNVQMTACQILKSNNVIYGIATHDGNQIDGDPETGNFSITNKYGTLSEI
ncbi:mannose 6-phosphate receptor protein, partial [Biomphalaria glabrata]